MHPSARPLGLSLTLAPVVLSLCHAEAGGAEGLPVSGSLDCVPACGTKAKAARAPCAALRADIVRADAVPADLRLRVPATGFAALAARLERLTESSPLPGPCRQPSVTGRDLVPEECRRFVRDPIRFGLTPP